MRYIGPKNRLSRREGVDLELKTFGSNNHGKLMRKLSVPPGQHGANVRRKSSEHRKQLREKQKIRAMFDVNEKQLNNYFSKAKRAKGNTGVLLVQMLESRLDNVVYRAGFAPTRAAARQLVSHGHVMVNGKINSIPSYHVAANDVVSFAREATTKIPAVESAMTRKDHILPTWLDRDGAKVTIKSAPSTETVQKQINLRLIIEFYSK
jgi:small subunit ribosomal protein S4